jgi:hypothetical protein
MLILLDAKTKGSMDRPDTLPELKATGQPDRIGAKKDVQ